MTSCDVCAVVSLEVDAAMAHGEGIVSPKFNVSGPELGDDVTSPEMDFWTSVKVDLRPETVASGSG